MTVLPVALLVSGLMAYAANLGGQIRHAEVGGCAVETPGAVEAAERAQDDEGERRRD